MTKQPTLFTLQQTNINIPGSSNFMFLFLIFIIKKKKKKVAGIFLIIKARKV